MGSSQVVRVELSTTPTFEATSPADFIGVFFEDSSTKPQVNNSPKGFFRFTPSTSAWATLVGRATQKDPDNPRVYYRVQQCFDPDIPVFAACVVSVLPAAKDDDNNAVPRVLLADTALFGGACSFAPMRRGYVRWFTGAWLVLALALRRRRLL